MNIPFNKPFIVGDELKYIEESVRNGQISGDGIFTKKCHDFFQEKYNFRKCLLTTSCTDALEMAALLIDIKEGDEVIMPAFTFVSTANAFVLRGANIVFADSGTNNPNIDVTQIESLITYKTKAIVVVHYAGIACDMDAIVSLADKYGLFIIEDAAQAIDSYYKGKPLGSIGHLAAFSFHETKNIISGEGGMLVINDERFIERAEMIREKGTNRSKFFRGEVDKYGWVDVGSSFLPSDIIAAFLFGQLAHIDKIQKQRKAIWNAYYEALFQLAQSGTIKLPFIPDFATNNAHMLYVLLDDLDTRSRLIKHLKENGVLSVFHYLSLNQSPYFTAIKGIQPSLPNSDTYTNTLLRLPLFYEMTMDDVDFISKSIYKFFT